MSNVREWKFSKNYLNFVQKSEFKWITMRQPVVTSWKATLSSCNSKSSTCCFTQSIDEAIRQRAEKNKKTWFNLHCSRFGLIKVNNSNTLASAFSSSFYKRSKPKKKISSALSCPCGAFTQLHFNVFLVNFNTNNRVNKLRRKCLKVSNPMLRYWLISVCSQRGSPRGFFGFFSPAL